MAGQEQLMIFACPGATFVENVAVAGLLGMLSYVAQYSYARSGPGIDYCISPQSTQRMQRAMGQKSEGRRQKTGDGQTVGSRQ